VQSPSETRAARSSATVLALLLASACAPGVLAQAPVPADTTSPRIATNREANDVPTKLGLIEQEIQEARQEAMYSNLLRQYDSQMGIRRTQYASGTSLVPAYVFTPKPFDSGKHYPGLLIVHGGWHSSLDWHFFDLIAYAVGKGYVVLFPEYHSSSGYGETNAKSNFGVTDIADVLAGADYLAHSVAGVDPDRLGIYGHSRGGMLTLMAIERAPKKFKAAVDVAGLADLIAFMSYKPDYRRQETASEPYFGGKLPSENLAPYIELSPLNHVDDIQTPLFFAGTTGDKIVPLTLHGGRLIDALKARNKVFEEKIYDNAPGDHLFLFGDTPERRDLFERTFAFLAKYLKP